MLKISKAALVAAVLSLSAVPATGLVAASAEETTTSSSGLASSLTIPTIVAVDSSMDEAALRDALSGGFMNHVNELATLSATSITIPEITLSMTVTSAGTPMNSIVTYKDIVLTNVKDGVAESASVGSADTTSAEGSFHFGKMSTGTLDFGGILALYSLVPSGSADQPMKVLYKDFSFEGGTLTTPMVNCTFGKVTAAEFDARPLKVSFAALMEAADKLGAVADGATPPPEATATVVGFMTDVFQAFKSEPVNLDGLSCAGTGEDGQPFELSLGSIVMDGYQPGIYPAITFNDIKVTNGGANSVTLAKASVKATDLSGPIAAIGAAGELTPAWLDANYRLLIPAFGGFSLSGLNVDVPNPEKPDERITASLADFDLSLSDYVNGIPTRISSSTHGFDVPLPTDSTDDNVKMLLMLGIERVNMGYDFAAHWDKDARTISLDNLSVTGKDLGSIAASVVVGNAVEDLFATDMAAAMTASQGVTFQSAAIDTTDDGMLDKFIPLMAAMQQVDPAQFRTLMAGQAEGSALQMLGATDQARALGLAISNFIAGTAKSLHISITSKDPAGVPAEAMMNGAADPNAVLGLLDITGTAQ